MVSFSFQGREGAWQQWECRGQAEKVMEERRRIPKTLEEAYRLRDSAGSIPERDFYQVHV